MCVDVQQNIIPNIAEVSEDANANKAMRVNLHTYATHTSTYPVVCLPPKHNQTYPDASQICLSNHWYILTITANKSLLPSVPCPSPSTQLLIAAAVSEQLCA